MLFDYRLHGVSLYLLTLAASDSFYLVSVFLSKTLTTLRCWYFIESALDIVNRSNVSCVLLQYLCDLFSNNSTCVILAFTVERAVAVFRPMRYKELCTVCSCSVTLAQPKADTATTAARTTTESSGKNNYQSASDHYDSTTGTRTYQSKSSQQR